MSVNVKLKKHNEKNVSVFSISLSCKRTLSIIEMFL